MAKILTLTEPATGEPIAVRMSAADGKKVTIRVEVPPNVAVTHERDPEPPTRLP